MKLKRIGKVVITLFVCAALICSFAIYKANTYTVTKDEVKVSPADSNPANRRQFNSSVKLFTWNGQLYFYSLSDRTQYYRELCVFEDHGVRSIGKFAYIYALENDYLYYEGGETTSHLDEIFWTVDSSAKYPIMSLNLRNNQHTQLAEVDSFTWHDIFYGEDGTVYLPDDSAQTDMYYVVNGETISGPCASAERYTLNNSQYAIENHELIRYTGSGDREVLQKFAQLGPTCIIPCENGLLIYNEGTAKLLYYIDAETETLQELLAFEGFASTSAVNVYQDQVYVSFVRYETIDGCSLKEFKNDTKNGTYRINLKDYSCEKLSDSIYNGLYIFDDSGIFACDSEGCVYKLDFDGNVIMTLLK